MAVTKERRAEIVREFGRGPNDSGSPETQIALITERLNGLSGHFEKHVKDHHSRRGLLRLVGQRKQLLNFLLREDITRYRAIKEKLKIR